MTHSTYTDYLDIFAEYVHDNITEGVPRFTVGQIRGSVSTRMHEAGVAYEIKEMIQGHFSKRDTGKRHYDIWEYKNEKRLRILARVNTYSGLLEHSQLPAHCPT